MKCDKVTDINKSRGPCRARFRPPEAKLFFPLQFRTPSTFYPSDFKLFHHLGISSDGINAIVTHFIIAKKKSQQEGLNSHPESKQCNAVLHVALPTALRAADGSKGGLTNIYLGLNHPRWIGCMQMSTRGLWLAVCKWVRTGVRNCSGINNIAPRKLYIGFYKHIRSCYLNLILKHPDIKKKINRSKLYMGMRLLPPPPPPEPQLTSMNILFLVFTQQTRWFIHTLQNKT